MTKRGDKKRKITPPHGNKNKLQTTAEMQSNNNTQNTNISQLAQAATAAHFQNMMPQGYQTTTPLNYYLGQNEEPPWARKLIEKIDSVDRRFTQLEAEMFKRFEQLESSITFINNEFESFKSNLAEMKHENSHLKQDIIILKEAVIDNKCRSMRNNLLLHGVAENKDEKCEEVVKKFVQEKLAINTEQIEIERCHRIGGYQHGKCRPIVTRFLRFKDKESIKKSGHKLKGTRFGLGDQFPKEINARRAVLRPIEKDHKSRGQPAFMSIDKLYTTGWCYYVDDQGRVQKTASRRPVHSANWQRQGEQPSITQPPQTRISDLITGAHEVLHAGPGDSNAS